MQTHKERGHNTKQKWKTLCDSGWILPASVLFSVLFLLLHFFPPFLCSLSSSCLSFIVSAVFFFLWFLISFHSYFFLKKRETCHLKAEKKVKPKRNDTLSPSIITYVFGEWIAGGCLFISPRCKFTIIQSIIWLCPKDTQHFLILLDGDRWQFLPKLRWQVRRRPLWNSYNPDYQRNHRPSFPGEAFMWTEATLRAEGGYVGKCSLWRRWKTSSISPHCHLVILNTFEQHIDVAKWQQKSLIYKVLADDQCGRLLHSCKLSSSLSCFIQ